MDATEEPDSLHPKYHVHRLDGRDAPGEKHHGCNYFVMDVSHDRHAAPALRAYAASCQETQPGLARDLIKDAEDIEEFFNQ